MFYAQSIVSTSNREIWSWRHRINCSGAHSASSPSASLQHLLSSKQTHLPPPHPAQTQHCIIMGDFNSHSPSWGCEELGNKGEEVEYVGHKSTTDPDQPPIDPPSYYSRSWKTSTPDLAFASDSYTKCATEKPVPN